MVIFFLATLFGRILLRNTLSPQPPTGIATTANNVYSYTDDERDRRRKFMLNFLQNNIEQFAKSELNKQEA
jgi:inositol polyphosphate 5-phosphatase INPP5B/F